MTNTEQARTLNHALPGMETSDGAGVKLRRSIGANNSQRLDPFLMLDEFGTENPDDYIAGFPPHPHRGFETVTYMIDGHMRHEDHLGNVGELKSGGVQWMTAGHGVIHSEMPQQESGRMRGFQLWLNLPAREKMKPASYQDIPAESLTTVQLDNGGQLKLIAGRLVEEGNPLAGPINGQAGSMATDPLFVDLSLPAGSSYRLRIPRGHNAFAYAYEGSALIGGQPLAHQHAGILDDGDFAEINAGENALRMIVVAGKPLGEPVVQYGPFVMNTREEIEQALADYRQGVLTG
ncbi:MAG TPA: pirin family protein [Xanthomonadales bacterium]|nr:pirin family protein [Xanthomonadales bacterium]